MNNTIVKIISAMVIVTLVSCSSPAKKENPVSMQHDIHSYAIPSEAVVKHLNVNLIVDFNKKQLSGTATLTIDNVSKGNALHLDTRDLNIEKVTLDDNSTAAFELKKAVQYLGSELVITIKPETKKVIITYSTSPNAAALQWLSPEQTAGGKTPFLFTQSQAILARTWIPLQDSPGIRFTYNATIQCPKELMAVMSANNDTVKNADGIYHFEMPQAIPSYLMALAVGDFQFHSYDSRSGVFAEPITMSKAAAEFVDMPAMISAAEELYGPYAWGRYDVLVLPPSFPFGGMENPRITFATPTILAGDRSLVALIAHELAHSWSGNLVTNATWNDFWLNEGFTVYFETRIMEKLYGKPYADMLTVLNKEELIQTIADLGKDHEDTKLYLNLAGRDPDEGVTDIAYQKGRFFLTTIEEAVGREKWDAFVNKYFSEHAFQSVTTEKFLNYLKKELIKGDTALENKIRINDWVYGPGLPDNCIEVKSDELAKATGEADAFMKGKKSSDLNTASWTTHHWLQFLRHLPDSLSLENMSALDKQFHFTQSGNSEIKCDWLVLTIHSKYETAYPALEEFLMSVGRRKFLKPLYAAMIATPSGKIMAKNIYTKARPGYHAVAYHTIDEMFKD
jgi:leukotriene-A4 hydrolase